MAFVGVAAREKSRWAQRLTPSPSAFSLQLCVQPLFPYLESQTNCFYGSLTLSWGKPAMSRNLHGERDW